MLEEVGPGAGLIALDVGGAIAERRNTPFMAAARRRRAERRAARPAAAVEEGQDQQGDRQRGGDAGLAGGSFVAGFDTTPVATSAATRTPASPSPATSPEAARTPASRCPPAGAAAALGERAHAAADVERRHRGERQVDADREREARDAAQHRADREPGAGEHEPPGQRAGEHALDDRLHQRRLRRRDAPCEPNW